MGLFYACSRLGLLQLYPVLSFRHMGVLTQMPTLPRASALHLAAKYSVSVHGRLLKFKFASLVRVCGCLGYHSSGPSAQHIIRVHISYFLVTVTKYPQRRNLREKIFLLAHSLRKNTP